MGICKKYMWVLLLKNMALTTKDGFEKVNIYCRKKSGFFRNLIILFT